MLTIERVLGVVAHLPTLVRIGLVGLAFAGLADVIAHLEAGTSAVAGDGHQHTTAEYEAHLAGFLSMVLIQVGVVADGIRRSRRPSVESSSKGVV